MREPNGSGSTRSAGTPASMGKRWTAALFCSAFSSVVLLAQLGERLVHAG